MKKRIFIERIEEALYLTNSVWEIQNVKPFIGGSVKWNGYYRIRHVGTGMYLSLPFGQFELTFKEVPEGLDTLFYLRRENQADPEPEDENSV